MRSVLALDQGTTGSTALVIAADGRVLGRGYREFKQHFPQPGWVEHEPADLLRATLDAAREALAAAAVTPECIGITNQRETVVVWDKATGVPVHRALVWQDRRTADRCVALAGSKDFIAQRTGLVLDAYFSATKIEWLLRSNGGLMKRAMNGELLAGTVDTWLIWQLTDGAVQRCTTPGCGAADHRRRGRPTVGAVRPGLRVAGRGEEHLRHRRVHADEHRCHASQPR